MEMLKALRQVIEKFKIRKINVITPPKKGEKPDIFQKMYEALGHEKYRDEEAFKEFIYEGKKVDERTHRKNVAEFTERMLNTLLFIDAKQEKFKTRGQTDTTIHRHLAAVNTLKIIGTTVASVPLAEKIVEMGIDYDLPLPTIDAANYLAHYYSLRLPDDKKFKYYSHIIIEQLDKFRREVFISGIYCHLFLIKIVEPASLYKLRERIKSHLHTIEKIAAMTDIPDVIMQTAYIKLQIYPEQKHAQKRISICRKALEKLNKKAYPPTKSNLLLLLYIALTQCSSAQFKAAEKSLQQATLISKNLHNAYQCELLGARCLTYLRSGQYDKAVRLLNKLPSSSIMSTQSNPVQNGWILNRAYLLLLISTGKAKASGKRDTSGAAIERFFDNPPDFEKGQLIQYVSIIIAKFIYLLNMRKRSEAQELVQPMRTYLNRAKKQPHLKRMYIFLEMLCTIPAARFKPLAVEYRSKKWLDELRQHPLELTDQPFEIELIPFETLWEIVLDILKKKKRKAR